ncbi:MAG: sigma-70 family RNA polymerase sigma factor [Candidatus Pacebacteria bacterium]|nr:sigma-70 family RNA polymerase sigma factor [Candidatus Paceibacterota bacterium]
MKEIPLQSKALEQTFLAGYEKHTDELFRFCVVKVRNRDEAMDIVQETFIRAWEYLRKGNVIEQMRPFLFRTARNIIIDHARKHKTISLDAMQEEQRFDAPDTRVQPFGIGFELDRMLAALETLEPTHREVLSLRFLQELDIPEIAEVLGLNPNAVSVRIHRGIEALKKQLGDEVGIET